MKPEVYWCKRCRRWKVAYDGFGIAAQFKTWQEAIKWALK